MRCFAGARSAPTWLTTPTPGPTGSAQLADAQYFAYCGITDQEAARCDFEGDAVTWTGAHDVVAMSVDRGPNVCAAFAKGNVHCIFSLGEGGQADQWSRPTAQHAHH